MKSIEERIAALELAVYGPDPEPPKPKVVPLRVNENETLYRIDTPGRSETITQAAFDAIREWEGGE